MKKGSKRPCQCSLCERPRILRAWNWGVTWRTESWADVLAALGWPERIGLPGPLS